MNVHIAHPYLVALVVHLDAAGAEVRVVAHGLEDGAFCELTWIPDDAVCRTVKVGSLILDAPGRALRALQGMSSASISTMRESGTPSRRSSW